MYGSTVPEPELDPVSNEAELSGKNEMTEADIKDEVEGRFVIQEGSVPTVRTSVDSVKKVFVDTSVHEIGAPKLSDLWRNFSLLPNFMPLFKVLVWRSISLRYSQSFLGVLWVAVQPVASTLMVLFMFNIIKVNTADGSHQGIFLFTGIMVWQFFARGLGDVTGSLLAHAGILTKIYLPKIMLPLASVMAAWFDTLIMITLLIIACVALGIPLSPRIMWLPVFLTIVCLASLCIGIGLAPLNALYRDVGMILPFALQFGMFASPVYYATRFIPEKYQLLYHLNPMVSLIEGVRWSLLPESPAPDLTYLAINLCTILVMLGISVFTYQRLEAIVIDRI
jgi:lipopolysaccharide transport system permease protein